MGARKRGRRVAPLGVDKSGEDQPRIELLDGMDDPSMHKWAKLA
jgi:hypothetical protein